MRDLGVLRKTASKYLDSLTDAGFLQKEKIGTTNYYINEPLFNLFAKDTQQNLSMDAVETITFKK
jgi:predicted transcriptional regulator